MQFVETPFIKITYFVMVFRIEPIVILMTLDDTESIQELRRDSNMAETTALSWFSAMGLLVNTYKTQKIIFTNKETNQQYIKYLGLRFQSSLSWSCHIIIIRHILDTPHEGSDRHLHS